jgi:quercetin dioxygenase-like cupin family protein
VKGRVLHAQHATLIVYDYTPRTVVATHKHDVEQFGVVAKGSLAMVIAGEQRILMVGDTFRIPAGTAHGARVFEEITQVVQVFAPARTDLPKPGSDGAAKP